MPTILPTVLIVDDDAALREGIAEALADLGFAPAEAADGEAALAWLRQRRADAVLLDLRMPGLDGMEVLLRIRASPDPPPVAVLTAVPTAANTIEAMRLGAADHLAKPVGRADLAALIERLLPAATPESAGQPAGQPAAAEDTEADLVGSSFAMREVQKQIGLLADNDATVLITGETGTGKEVVARAIHRHGRRAARPFVAINCAAIPADLLESQLFGHVRGAFTGAVADRVGSFREADRGTLFLDEVGDMAAALQAKLLRVLQERVVTPVGGRPAVVDVRVVAATHRDLPRAVREGQFREDLYYRIGVVPLNLPPLRDRLADIVPLAEHFLALAAPKGTPPKQLSADAAARLLAHPWPGNVRELRNAMDRVAAMVRRPVVAAPDLGFLHAADHALGAAPGEADWLPGDLPGALARVEEAMIRRALRLSGGNRAQAARQLGIHRQLLHAKIARYGLEAFGKDGGDAEPK
jgi:DNA-binding NtrC family response regulator